MTTISAHPYGAPAHVARSRQAALAAAKVLWLDIDAVNRQNVQDDVLFRKHERAILFPLRGTIPYFNTADIWASYGVNQASVAATLADDFAGLYWLICRRRLELERPPDIMSDNGPDWTVLRQVYADRLHWYSVLGATGVTVLTAMRVLDRLQHRGGHAALDELALEQTRRQMEPVFSQRGSQVRLERVGPVRVGGHPKPEVRDYGVLSHTVPQIGRRPVDRKQLVEEI